VSETPTERAPPAPEISRRALATAPGAARLSEAATTLARPRGAAGHSARTVVPAVAAGEALPARRRGDVARAAAHPGCGADRGRPGLPGAARLAGRAARDAA